jgi:predicted AAA+ superfamily ATPase
LFKRCKFVKNKTIIFFDEIQECDKARASLKYFYMDKRFDVICSGSLFGIKFTNRAPIPVGYEEIINLLPLDFEEFLLALGKQKESIDYLKKLFKEKNTVPSYIHKEMLELFKKYIVIGGMPEVVKTFIETSSYSEV